MKLDLTHWPTWSSFVAAPSEPEEYCEAAVERLMERIAPWVIDVKNVRPQFHAKNRIRMISFETKEDRERYDSAYIRYIEACDKVKDQGNFAVLVEWLKFRQEAELIRAPYLAAQMYGAVQEGYAAICACNFKASIAKVTAVLYERFRVPRSKISLIWGGSNIYSTKEEDRFSPTQIQAVLTALMQGKKADPKLLKAMKQQLLADIAGLGGLPQELNLGPQNYVQRQEEIDRFQSGESLYCCFNFKSGGVGLSLHHTDELCEVKCRRKESGYAYEEDIPLVPTRPRKGFFSPTYSAIEMVQALGRGPRISSLSDTEQELCFYRDTIEVHVAAITSQKLRCLKKVVRQREHWEDIIFAPRGSSSVPAPIPDEDTVVSEELFGDIEEDDDEDEN